ncbi:MAG: ChaB family protein [Rivularia sp. (in: cyanobacteria)]
MIVLLLICRFLDIKDLPESVKNHFPKHASEIFIAAFNNAIEEYDEEEMAFKVAWTAVKRDYEKGEDGDWHPKPD